MSSSCIKLCTFRCINGICSVMVQPQIILASSSQTRKDLMDRLGINYICISPDIDESPRDETHADELAKDSLSQKLR